MGERDVEHPVADRSDHQRWATGPRRHRMQHAPGGVVVLAVEVDRSVGQQCADDRERFLEPAHPMVVREAERSVVRRVPSRAEGEDQPPAGDGVDGRRLLGEHRRGVEARARHEWTELDRGGRRGERGERRPHLPRPARPDGEVVQQVIAEPERVEPDLLGRLRHGDQLGERHLPFDLRQLHPDLHRWSP